MGPPISVREEHLLTVRVDRENGSLLVRASGEIDHANAGMLEEELGRAFGSDASVIVLDLGDVDFIGVAGVHALLLERGALPREWQSPLDLARIGRRRSPDDRAVRRRVSSH